MVNLDSTLVHLKNLDLSIFQFFEQFRFQNYTRSRVHAWVKNAKALVRLEKMNTKKRSYRLKIWTCVQFYGQSQALAMSLDLVEHN